MEREKNSNVRYLELSFLEIFYSNYSLLIKDLSSMLEK
jgi:hypothetical protein